MDKIYQKNLPLLKNAVKGRFGGFTLIELLVVVLIIGILAAIALPQYEKAVERSRAAEALTMVSAIAKANDVYKMTTGNYTSDISVLDIQIPGEDISFNGRPRKNTKFFMYGSQSPSYAHSTGIANRLPQSSKYSIVALDNATMLCYYFNEDWKAFCRGLGSGVEYDSSSYIIN